MAESTDSVESSAAREQRTGYPWLRFEDPRLEAEFRSENAARQLPQVRQSLWLAVILLAAVAVMARSAIEGPLPTTVYLIQFGVVLPLLLTAIGLSYTPRATRHFPRDTPLIFGLVSIAIAYSELSVRKVMGAPFASVLILAIPYAYTLLGLRFYQAVVTAGLGSVCFLIGAHRAEFPDELLQYQIQLIVVANVVGAAMGYQLERLQRANFLESRRLLEAAARDGLTGLFNRRRFDEHLDSCWNYAQRDGKLLAVLLVDIDSFKPYNDRYGHQAGDLVLRQVGMALARSARRPLDFVARYGGEEFAVILFEPTREYVAEVADRIHAEVAALQIPHEGSVTGSRVSVSIGAAILNPSPERSAAGGLQLADEALYAAKETGRNRTVYREAEYAALATGVFRRYRRETGAR
ncbi:MAG: diguanylate cyclase domain-containing protein [Gammaproteobacteria bacterium]